MRCTLSPSISTRSSPTPGRSGRTGWRTPRGARTSSSTCRTTASRRPRCSTSGWATGGRCFERFAADRGPVYFRPHGDTGTVLRRLQAAGVRLGVFTDAPRELADIALAHVGAARRVEVVGTLDEVLAALGDGATVVHTRDELGAAAAVYHSEHGAH